MAINTSKLICVLSFLILGTLLLSCSAEVPTLPREAAETPREVLIAFARACQAKDVDTASRYLLRPQRWRKTLELARDVLPFYGDALALAEEVEREENCVKYRVRISHPDDPEHRVIFSKVFVLRVRGIDGNTGEWGVDFVPPSKGDWTRPRFDPSQVSDRSAQWGTLYAHASILTRAILAYYFTKYPDDYEFNGVWGYFNPKLYRFPILVTHPGPIETILFVDYDIYESIPPDAVVIYNVASALMQAGSADEDVFVGELNEDGSVNFTREIKLTFGGGIKFVTTNDFGDDDDTFLKGFAHFLTPVTQSAWETQFAPFDDAQVLGGTQNASVRSIDWALGEGTLGPYNLLGVLSMRASRNLKTFPRAVELLKQAKSAGDGLTSAELLANSFYTLGYNMHLLEDLSCPAHCRNDMHGVPIISSIPGLGSLQPDPMEDWAETLTPSFINETIKLYFDLLTHTTPILRDSTGFPADPILQNLYLNASHTDYPAVEALFEYTALMANRMCFSEDTIYRSTNPQAANTDYYPDLTSLHLDFFGRSIVYGTPGEPISTNSYLAACGNGMFDVWRSWFWLTHGFKDPKIGDVEDALRSGWDILTVEDEADDDYFADPILGVREQQWRLLFPLIVRTGAALMHEFYLESCRKE